MARRRDFRANFEYGELSDDYLRRADSDQLVRACRRLRNAFLKSSGGFMRRPGSVELAVLLAAKPRIYEYKGQDGVEIFVLTDGRLDIYDPDGTKTRTFPSNIPWSEDELDSLVFESDQDTVYVSHQAFKTQVFTRGGPNTWDRSDFAFQGGSGNEILQPYFRFGQPNAIMTIGAYSGSGVSITFDEDVLTADHVGARFRYMQANEVEIDSVTDGQNGTCTIKSRLYPTVDITVTNTIGFKVGQVVQTEIDELNAVVAQVVSGTVVRVIMRDSYDEPDVPGTGDPNKLIGPESAVDISSVASVASPIGTSIWDEQMVSDMRGYPGTIAVHRGRLFLGRFRDAPDAIAASAVNNFTEFFTGGTLTAADGFIERLGHDPNSEVRHFVSAEQLIVFTDRGAYYVPESAENPITPESVEFLRIGPEGASDVPPALANEGVLFIDEDAKRLMAVIPTGNIRRSWAIIELSELSYDLIGMPTRLAISNGIDGRSERLVYILNDDGTLTVVMYRRGSDVTGWGVWSRGRGTWRDVITSADDVYLSASIDGEDRLCQFKFSAIADDELDYSSAQAGRASTESVVVENKTVTEFGTLDGSGEMPDEAPGAGKTLGVDFALEMEPAPPISPNIGWERQRIVSGRVDVLDTGAFRLNGSLKSPYEGGDDLSIVGFTRSRTERAFQLGWNDAPQLSIEQYVGEGAPLETRAITMEVAS